MTTSGDKIADVIGELRSALGNPNSRILVVEGKQDKKILKSLFSELTVRRVEGKPNVLRIASELAADLNDRILFLVDRDFDDAELPNRFVVATAHCDLEAVLLSSIAFHRFVSQWLDSSPAQAAKLLAESLKSIRAVSGLRQLNATEGLGVDFDACLDIERLLKRGKGEVHAIPLCQQVKAELELAEEIGDPVKCERAKTELARGKDLAVAIAYKCRSIDKSLRVQQFNADLVLNSVRIAATREDIESSCIGEPIGALLNADSGWSTGVS